MSLYVIGGSGEEVAEFGNEMALNISEDIGGARGMGQSIGEGEGGEVNEQEYERLRVRACVECDVVIDCMQQREGLKNQRQTQSSQLSYH